MHKKTAPIQLRIQWFYHFEKTTKNPTDQVLLFSLFHKCGGVYFSHNYWFDYFMYNCIFANYYKTVSSVLKASQLSSLEGGENSYDIKVVNIIPHQ